MARFLARLRHADELTAARVEIRQLNESLGKEQMLTTGLTSEVKELTRQVAEARLRADSAVGEAARLRADKTFVAAERCECGGDAELYWRRQAAAAETQARQDRVNVVALVDKVERLQLIADEAERLHHIVEQLERNGIVRVA